MGLLSHSVRKEDIKPGDHIYTWRACFTYSHHGIYVGENKVIHFTNPAEEGVLKPSSSSRPSSPCPTSTDCGFRRQADDSGVIVSCVDCFVGKGSLRLFEYGVTELSFQIKRPGTCTTEQPDPSETVIHRATYLLQHGFGNYDMFVNNCEDFAVYCKTGLLNTQGFGRSGQVSSSLPAVALAGFLAGVLRNPADLLRNPVAALGVAFGAGLYCRSRHDIDTGVNTHVVQVPVEMLALYIRNRRPRALPPLHASTGLKEIEIIARK